MCYVFVTYFAALRQNIRQKLRVNLTGLIPELKHRLNQFCGNVNSCYYAELKIGNKAFKSKNA